ncbi:MAG TPA: CopD family protein [Anaerolineales bacterium]|nr:CopD family protein [Anaerolineales bacterium]
MISLGETTPYWALSLAFWLHLLATVAWIGGLVALVILVLPAARKSLEPETYARFLEQLQRRLDPLGWLSLAVLLATGLFQMSANPNYAGFLSISNRWAASMLLKHILFIGMIGVSAYLTWGILPALRRIALMRVKGMDAQAAEKLLNRETQLLRINLVLGVLILGLTALARAA